MKQILLSIFFVLILGFSIAGYTQTLDDGNMVEEDNQKVITDET